MDCLRKTKKFKNKHPVWSEAPPEEDNLVIEVSDDEKEDEEQNLGSQDKLSDSKDENWSGSESSSDDDDDDDMYAGDVRSDRISLETKTLQFKHLTNVNNEKPGGVKLVQFHPKSKVALVAGRRGREGFIDLFEVDGERNRYLQGIQLPKTRQQPFCSFTPAGNTIVISSESYKQTFFTYDMVSAKKQDYTLRVGRDLKDMTDFVINQDYMACRMEGSNDIYILSSKTYEIIYSIRLNEPARAIQFTDDNEVFIAGENAKVYIWDLKKTSTCKHTFLDEGTVHITSMSISQTSNLLSLGSDTGIVNSYDFSTCQKDKFPTPIRSFANLKTSVDLARYNNSGELLLFGSKIDRKAFKLAHSLSGIVYKNFPAQTKDYGHLVSADFSPLSGYLMLGCSTGRAYLCRLPYFKSY